MVDGQSQDVLSLSAGDTGPGGTSGVQAETQTKTMDYGISDDNYSVVLLADFNLTATGVFATKVMDFQNLSSDAGLYLNDATGLLEFINGLRRRTDSSGAHKHRRHHGYLRADCSHPERIHRAGLRLRRRHPGAFLYRQLRSCRAGGCDQYRRCLSDPFQG